MEVTAERMGQDGDGVARMPDGRLAFVPHLLPGERAEVVVTEEHRNFVRARTVRQLSVSPERVQPPCPVFSQCGGCAFQHWQYSAELRHKEQRVRRALTSVGLDATRVDPICGAAEEYGYRNKGQFPYAEVGGRLILGLYQRQTHQVVDLVSCAIQDRLVNAVLEAAGQAARELGLTAYRPDMHRGLLRHLLIRSSRFERGVLVLIVAAENHPRLRRYAEVLKERVPAILGVGININRSDGNRVLGDTTHLVWGRSSITEQILHLNFQLSFTSFFQINPDQAARLFTAAVDFLPSRCGEVWDLYAGVGILAALAASRSQQVRAVEINPQAVRDAQRNFAINGLSNVLMEVADVEHWIGQWRQTGRAAPEVVMVDPPRSGLRPQFLETLRALGPDRIIYVSCKPETWARDLKALVPAYRLVHAAPVDMFPRTDHVEVASLLLRSDVKE